MTWKSRVPVEVLNKHGGLTDEEWRIMTAHPWLGVLTLFGIRGYGEIPYRGMIVAYEHHMKSDLTGYPKSIRPRELSIFSKIVAVADGFDAATSRRVYQTVPIQPDQVLKEMWENPRRGYDQVVVKAFINLIGIYPVGTCVILDSYEVAIVHAANADVSKVHGRSCALWRRRRARCSNPNSGDLAHCATPRALSAHHRQSDRPASTASRSATILSEHPIAARGGRFRGSIARRSSHISPLVSNPARGVEALRMIERPERTCRGGCAVLDPSRCVTIQRSTQAALDQG